ncbi:hypothetical protein ABID26_007052 [Mesorhizobium shonense]|uniref:Transposase n=1 Tax=Mesorhizobium shonense TaxID=1209948 RepID=A0ABV2I3Z6_9HYPH
MKPAAIPIKHRPPFRYAAGFNFSLLLNWFRQLLWLLIAALQSRPKSLEA